MLRINSIGNKVFLIISIIFVFTFMACSNDENPVETGGNETAKVSGKISSSSSSQSFLGKTVDAESVDGAAVVLAQIQADGSLKTVSTQSVQTDVNGKFVVETNVSDVNNLVVVAEKAGVKWKAIVSAKVKKGTTVYAPPLNSESTAEADLYIKLVERGEANGISQTDLKWFINSEVAAQIKASADSETKFITAVKANSEATSSAAGNSYFGLTNAQIQAMLKAKTDACAKLDEELYINGESEAGQENAFRNYEGAVIAANASNNISANTYAKLMRIGISAYTNASASMQAQARLAASKSFYLRYALVLNYAMQQQFQAAGASSSQMNAVNSAGLTLYASIKNSGNSDEIKNAFVQYSTSVKTQLKLVLSAQATIIDSIDVAINSTGGARAVLSASINVGVNLNTIVNAYITFYNAFESTVQTTLTGAASAHVNAAAQIMILANAN